MKQYIRLFRDGDATMNLGGNTDSNTSIDNKFRKKPVVINAVQWNGDVDSWNEIQKMGCTNTIPGGMGTKSFSIRTLEGYMKADCGDWIIKGVAGEFYPCKPDIFEKTYEPASTLSSSHPISEDFEVLYNVKHIECSFAEEQIKNLTEENERLKGETMNLQEGVRTGQEMYNEVQHENKRLKTVLAITAEALRTYGSHPIIENKISELLS